MQDAQNRRDFLKQSSAIAAAAALSPALARNSVADDSSKPLFRISLAEWSLHKSIFDKKIDNLDFAKRPGWNSASMRSSM